MEDVGNFIAKVGFPIFVACYMMYVQFNQSSQLVKALHNFEMTLSAVLHEVAIIRAEGYNPHDHNS